MKKYFYSFVSATLLSSAVSLSAMKLTDEVEISQRGTVMSKGLPTTQQYYGLPKVPLVHPYNMSSAPGDEVILAMEGKFPDFLVNASGISLGVTQRMQAAMIEAGVTANDPLIVVIQSYIPNTEEGDKPSHKVNLMRPQYYFSSNNIFQSAQSYKEEIKIKCAVSSLSGSYPIQITPDIPSSSEYSISVHNEGPNTPMISSGANMSVPVLKDQTFGFFAFYKAQGRTVNKVSVPDLRGISVLHFMVAQGLKIKIASELQGKKTVDDVVQALKTTPLEYASRIINGMCDDAK